MPVRWESSLLLSVFLSHKQLFTVDVYVTRPERAVPKPGHIKVHFKCTSRSPRGQTENHDTTFLSSPTYLSFHHVCVFVLIFTSFLCSLGPNDVSEQFDIWGVILVHCKSGLRVELRWWSLGWEICHNVEIIFSLDYDWQILSAKTACRNTVVSPFIQGNKSFYKYSCAFPNNTLHN